ncbi:uncharacterized protein TNIN_276241 [Trichonephila inaurata madagascariensis]|uniref:Uncharacterized protein n=1 Tax=Trichonephila inaurata madagascariensis TaxID=2747483 RepID=A0A8X7C971_9ARAC|nr:uncharacterized protein TNIN_276241 [Trichonephila inaurata madagascariensis]
MIQFKNTFQEQNHTFQRSNTTEKSVIKPNQTQSIRRRQDEGFDFMNYFINRGQQQEPATAQQQPQQRQLPLSIQQQHQLQQQALQLQQRRQQEQLLQLQQQQLLQVHQQQPRENYQDNVIQQYPAQTVALDREGGYGGVSIGSGYQQGAGYAAPQPREIAISIGKGKPILQVGNLLPLIPRIFRVLSGGGKVMFGVELGNNFYFGPVGAKPLSKAVLG